MNNLTMHDPAMLSVLTDIYFDLKEEEEELPTVPGLVLAIGFNTVSDITKTLERWEEGSDKYPDASIYILLQSLTRIEDIYVQEGIKGNMPAALVKFTLGAYHNRREAAQTDNSLPNNTNFQIVFNAPTDFMKRIGEDKSKAISSQRNLLPTTNVVTGTNMSIELPA